MSTSMFFEFVGVLLFLILVEEIHSQGIRFPRYDDYPQRPPSDRSRVESSDCDCIRIRQCTVLRNQRDWRTAGVRCGSGYGEYRMVCCPNRSVINRPVSSTRRPRAGTFPGPVPSVEPPVVSSGSSRPTGDCGRSTYESDLNPLIMGGQNATEGMWPWMAAIRIRETTGIYTPYCTGFLIDRRHVLSAAHCYETTAVDGYRARIGSINQDIGDEYRITRIAVPAGYRPGQFYDDIAILTLDQEVNFPTFNPVCLPNQQVSRIDLTGRGTTVAGWGADRNRGEQKKILQYLTRLPVMANGECQRALRATLQTSFRRQFPNDVREDLFICAAFREGGKDACGGDSGGPLMIMNENRWYAVGVVSFGFGCGIPGMPGGYTRISNHMDWIRQNTRD